MRLGFTLLTLLSVAVATSVNDDIKDSVSHIKQKTSDQVKKTADDIKNKTKDMSKDVSEKSQSIFSDIMGYVRSVVSDIVDFFRMLFGDNTPGQPALADPSASLSEAASPRYGTKTVYLSLLSALMWWSYKLTTVCGPKPKNEISSYYRNIESADLSENFL